MIFEIGDLLRLFYCTRVKEREMNVRIIEVLACSAWLEKYMQGF